MQVKVFSCYDSKAAAYAQPFFSPTVVTGRRAFGDACADPNTMLNKHPEDFTLFLLGTFDDQLGSFDLLSPPESLGLASSYLTQE